MSSKGEPNSGDNDHNAQPSEAAETPAATDKTAQNQEGSSTEPESVGTNESLSENPGGQVVLETAGVDMHASDGAENSTADEGGEIDSNNGRASKDVATESANDALANNDDNGVEATKNESDADTEEKTVDINTAESLSKASEREGEAANGVQAVHEPDTQDTPLKQAEDDSQIPMASGSEENICSRNTARTKRASLAARDIKVDADSIIPITANKEDIVRVQRTLYYIQHIKQCKVPGGCGNNCRTMQEAHEHLETCVEGINGNCELTHCLPTRLIIKHWNTCDRGKQCHICQPVRDEIARVKREEDKQKQIAEEQPSDESQNNTTSSESPQQTQADATDRSDVVNKALNSRGNEGSEDDSDQELNDHEELQLPICRCGHHTEPRDPVTAPVVDGLVNGTVAEISQLYFSDEPQNDVWDMFMKQEPSMQPYIDSYKNTPWKMSKKECCLERFFTFLSPPAALPSIMSSTHVPITQVHRKSQPDPDQLVYKTRAISHNVPYATVFAVDTTWFFVQKEKESVQMKVYVDVVFLQSCWVKAILRNATRPSAVDGAAAVAKMVVVLSHKVQQQAASNLEHSQSFPGSPMSADFRALVGANSPIPEVRESEDSDGQIDTTPTDPTSPADKNKMLNSPQTLRAVSPAIGDKRSMSYERQHSREPIISVGAPRSIPLSERELDGAEGSDADDTAHISDSDLPPSQLREKRFPKSTRPDMLRRHSTAFASQLSPQPHRSMSARYPSRLRQEPNLVTLFDDMKESEYQDIFGADAEMRVVQAANFNSEHPLGLEDGEMLDDIELMTLRVHDLPLSAMIPMVISIPLGLIAIYLWSRLGDCLHTNRRLGEEWEVLWHITEALSNESSSSEVHKAYERFATMTADEFSAILTEQTKAALEAQQLLASYSQLVSEFKGEYIDEGVSWGWISATITIGTVAILLLVGCALSVRLLKALTNPDS